MYQITILGKNINHALFELAKELGEEFAEQNEVEDEDIFVQVEPYKTETKAYHKMSIYLGRYFENPEESPLGCEIYAGPALGLSYVTCKGRLQEQTSKYECVRKACRNYKGNSVTCRVSFSIKIPKGNIQRIEQKIRKTLRHAGIKATCLKVEYNPKE